MSLTTIRSTNKINIDFTCNFKCDKVCVIVAWGKNYREESDKVFHIIGYRVCKGTCRVMTVIQLT